MEVVDAESLKKEKRTKVWKYDKFVEELKRIAGDREEVGLKIHMSEILEHLIDNRNVKKQMIRADEVRKMIEVKRLFLKFAEKEDIETLKMLLEAIIDKLEELEDRIIDLDVALSYIEIKE